MACEVNCFVGCYLEKRGCWRGKLGRFSDADDAGYGRRVEGFVDERDGVSISVDDCVDARELGRPRQALSGCFGLATLPEMLKGRS